ncbi:MAG: recombinase family protein [Lachnospiraceae bacterium]|nr:recombinase family protein [Lachnospiraceae bacterium]
MRPVITSYERQNEYAAPLAGTPYYRSSGIIYALDRKERRFAVGRVDYESYDDQNYQYVFSPRWSVIDALPSSVFQGIPGLDLSLRLEHYYRTNMTPCFISERTPGESREDLRELLDAVGLDYYDRFEWMLRAHMRCGTDNLIVERAVPARRFRYEPGQPIPEDLQPDDCVVIRGLDSMGTSNRQLRGSLLSILRSGAHILDESEERRWSEEERSLLLRLLLIQDELDGRNRKNAQEEGIRAAQKEGKYTGRKRLATDTNLLRQIAGEFERHQITEAEAMRRAGIGSRSTFYRRLREIRGNF